MGKVFRGKADDSEYTYLGSTLEWDYEIIWVAGEERKRFFPVPVPLEIYLKYIKGKENPE